MTASEAATRLEVWVESVRGAEGVELHGVDDFCADLDEVLAVVRAVEEKQ